MNIRKAAKLAHKMGTGIYRSGFGGIVFIPTNTTGRCLIVSDMNELKPGQQWTPSLNDLISKDWEVASQECLLHDRNDKRRD